MYEPQREIEGTWEEVSSHALQYAGRRVRLTLLDTDNDKTGNVTLPQRPEPTPEQARFGILPAATGNGSGVDIMRFVRSQPRMTDEEYEEFEQGIAENRARRRKLAAESTQ